MRPDDGPEDVEGRVDVGDPIAQRLADGILERPAAGVDGDDAGPQDLHANDVEGLALHVFRPHVDVARQSKRGRRGGRRHPVLARAGLGDDPALAHAEGEEHLADRVVDLVGAGVQEVLALQVDPRAAEGLGQPPGEVERGRPPAKISQVAADLDGKRGIGDRGRVRGFQFVEHRDQRLRHVAAAVVAEGPRNAAFRRCLCPRHHASCGCSGTESAQIGRCDPAATGLRCAWKAGGLGPELPARVPVAVAVTGAPAPGRRA